MKELGKDGKQIFKRQEAYLRKAERSARGESRSRYNTLVRTIYPRISMYKALAEHYDDGKANEMMRRYMIDHVAAEKHRKTVFMERFPLFFYIYRAVFLMIMKTTDLQESTQKCGRDDYDITITKCLWHDACTEQGCPGLCALFCDVDDVTYGGLKKIGFTRSQTLGYGGSCCDFHFYKK